MDKKIKARELSRIPTFKIYFKVKKCISISLLFVVALLGA